VGSVLIEEEISTKSLMKYYGGENEHLSHGRSSSNDSSVFKGIMGLVESKCGSLGDIEQEIRMMMSKEEVQGRLRSGEY